MFKNIFSLPHVKSELKRYANGFKGEAKESKEAFFVLGENLTRNLRSQVYWKNDKWYYKSGR